MLTTTLFPSFLQLVPCTIKAKALIRTYSFAVFQSISQARRTSPKELRVLSNSCLTTHTPYRLKTSTSTSYLVQPSGTGTGLIPKQRVQKSLKFFKKPGSLAVVSYIECDRVLQSYHDILSTVWHPRCNLVSEHYRNM